MCPGPGPVMLDERLDLLAGTGVDDRIIRILCEPFYDRVVGDIKGGDLADVAALVSTAMNTIQKSKVEGQVKKA